MRALFTTLVDIIQVGGLAVVLILAGTAFAGGLYYLLADLVS